MTSAILMSRNSWNDESILLHCLAEQLTHGRLLLCLGAGVSKFYGLPTWDELLDAVCAQIKFTLKSPSPDPTIHAQQILVDGFAGDVQAFRKAVHASLYSKAGSSDINTIINNPTMRAFGALVTRSLRGSVASIVTLNYDDIFERYLEHNGYLVQTVDDQRYLNSTADAVIFHPHGYLAEKNTSSAIERRIVITQEDYAKEIETLWQIHLKRLFATHVVVFIGLSGQDNRLANLLIHNKDAHAFTTAYKYPYFGIRICSEDDPLAGIWDTYGVYCKKVKNLSSEMPEFLYKVCRLAAEQIKSRTP